MVVFQVSIAFIGAVAGPLLGLFLVGGTTRFVNTRVNNSTRIYTNPMLVLCWTIYLFIYLNIFIQGVYILAKILFKICI